MSVVRRFPNSRWLFRNPSVDLRIHVRRPVWVVARGDAHAGDALRRGRFFVRFDVTQPANVSNDELIATWIREAEAAIGAMDAGAVPHLWKVAGQRIVLGVLDAPTAEDIDRALGGLPIIREMGPGMKTEAWPIYDYRTFAEDLNACAHGAAAAG